MVKVHNWTEQNVAQWLSEEVDLPNYADVIIKRHFTGALLPLYAFEF